MAAKEQVTATAAGKYVMWGHCGGGWYWWRKIVLSSGSASFFDVEVFSPEAIVCRAGGPFSAAECATASVTTLTSTPASAAGSTVEMTQQSVVTPVTSRCVAGFVAQPTRSASCCPHFPNVGSSIVGWALSPWRARPARTGDAPPGRRRRARHGNSRPRLWPGPRWAANG